MEDLLDFLHILRTGYAQRVDHNNAQNRLESHEDDRLLEGVILYGGL